MSYNLIQRLAHESNMGGYRDSSAIKWIVYHYTSNDGDTASANGNYFAGSNRHASAHYFVDDNTVVQSVPDNRVAWSVGGPNQSGHHPLKNICMNSNSISIEMCDTNRNGVVEITPATLENAYALGRALMKRYNIDIDHVVRHYDVNGKACPDCNGLLNDDIWNRFKQNIINSQNGPLGNNLINKPHTIATSNVIIGQHACNDFAGANIAVDGVFGSETKKGVVKVFQAAMNKDYNAGLVEDGIVGPNTLNALGNHYVKLGEKQWMVSAVEIALYCYGYNPNGIENPGVFGECCKKAVMNFQSDRGLSADGIAGRQTIMRMLGL